jgi:hypothetical protein
MLNHEKRLLLLCALYRLLLHNFRFPEVLPQTFRLPQAVLLLQPPHQEEEQSHPNLPIPVLNPITLKNSLKPQEEK